VPLSRRHFLAVAAGAGAAGLGLSGYAFGPAASTVVLTRHDALVPRLPGALDGLRIAQVSDVHLPANAGAVRNAIGLLEAERPEVVILTGDIVEHHSALDALVSFARRARGTVGTYAVMGNWERSGGIQPAMARRAYEAAGVQFLCNEAAGLRVGSARLAIAGLDDLVSGRPDTAETLARVEQADAIVWALHSPGFADLIPRDTPASLILGGHTHGGQIRLPGVGALFTSSRYGRRYDRGLHRLPNGGAIYTTSGIGLEGMGLPRARFACPPEVAVLEVVGS
jgi:predicted MPP superfamily phosphohydrolase